MQLTGTDRGMLAGDEGQVVAKAMELVVAIAEIEDAPCLVDIEAAHVDGCMYHGQAGLDFVEELAAGGGRVRVPTTLNITSVDLLHPELFRGDAEVAQMTRRVTEGYLALGCRPTWTCAPYQLPDRPRLGAQIAWGESNAIVFANSVLGARTNRYGDFLDICCALTGRAPFTGLHTDEGRRATLSVELNVPDVALDDDLLYPLLGHVLGVIADDGLPVVTGLDGRASEDRLKALGAAAASSGALAMFHAVGVTPEAPTLDESTGGGDTRTVVVDVEMLRKALVDLSEGRGELKAVSVGTPQMSVSELRSLAELARGRRSMLPFYVNTGRDTLEDAGGEVALDLEAFGATVVTDTCTYVTAIMGEVAGTVMTNSGKWAYYAPGNIGVSVVLGSLADCVESAAAGSIRDSRRWL
jgi:predicted aconitase